MKKVILLMMVAGLQLFSETMVKGTYYPSKDKTNGGKYKELKSKIEKKIELQGYTVSESEKFTIRTKDFDIIVSKSEFEKEYSKVSEKPLPEKLKKKMSYKEFSKIKGYAENAIVALMEQNKAIIYNKKNKANETQVYKAEGNLCYYYDKGRGSCYPDNGIFTLDFNNKIFDFDIITRFGVEIHSSTRNPYLENYEGEKEFVELYNKAKLNPEKEQRILIK